MTIRLFLGLEPGAYPSFRHWRQIREARYDGGFLGWQPMVLSTPTWSSVHHSHLDNQGLARELEDAGRYTVLLYYMTTGSIATFALLTAEARSVFPHATGTWPEWLSKPVRIPTAYERLLGD